MGVVVATGVTVVKKILEQGEFSLGRSQGAELHGDIQVFLQGSALGAIGDELVGK